MKKRIKLIVSIAILAMIAFLLLGPSGSLGRTIGRAYGGWAERHQTASQDPGPPLLHVQEADVFDSSVHPSSAMSELGRLATAFFVGDQRLLIADGLNAEIHLVDLQNDSVRSVGRRGDGPGEFRLLMGVLRTPNGFATWDVELARITMFSAAGDLVDSWAYSRLWFNKPVAMPVAVLSDGLVIFRDGEGPGNWRGRHRGEARYVKVTSDGVAGVVAEAKGAEYWWHASGGVQQVMLGHLLLEAQIGDEVAISQTDLGAIRIVNRDGETSAELPLAPGTRASKRQVEMVREGARERWRRQMERPAGGVFRESARMKLESVAEVPANDVSPPIDRLFVDLDGRLWLRSYAMPDDADVRWEAWDPSDLSGPRFVVAVHPTAKLLDASGSHVLLYETDEMGVVRVFVAALANED